MKYFLLIIIYVLLSCGIKEKQSTTKLFLVNNSSSNVEIIPIKNSIFQNEEVIHLEPKEKVMISNDYVRGLTEIPIYFPEFLESDSIFVVFNSGDTMLHIKYENIPSRKFYTLQSERNLYNTESYSNQLVEDSKYWHRWEVTYYFTEQDYMDAK